MISLPIAPTLIVVAIGSVTAMKLKAEIVIEIDAEDYVAAAGHQTAVEAIFDSVRASYSEASLRIRPMRAQRLTLARGEARRRVAPTGALAAYEDL
jgi:hypothetical protein